MANKKDFYNVRPLWHKHDMQGKQAAVCIACGNRTAGKTFSAKHLLIDEYLKLGREFVCIVRHNNDMDGYADAFWSDLGPIKYPGHSLSSTTFGMNLYKELWLDGEICGYVVSLNSANKIKPHSSRFVKAKTFWMDEFQSETGRYLKNEIHLYESVLMTLSRGLGEHIKDDMRVLLTANTVSEINPYFDYYGISRRLNKNAKFIRGEGWVLEQVFNVTASDAIKNHGVFAGNSKYMKYATNNEALLDNKNFVQKLGGDKRIVALLIHNGIMYGLWRMQLTGRYYIASQYDPNCVTRFSFNASDHNENTIISKDVVKFFKNHFDHGLITFETMQCKYAFIDIIGYNMFYV